MQDSSAQNLKNHSPSEFEGREKLVYITKNLDGYLSLSELREALVALAQNHYLSYQYIVNNFGANDHDALEEVFDAESKGIFKKVDATASTFKLFWRLNPGLSDEEIRAYIYPRKAKQHKPKIKKYNEVVRPIKKYPHHKQPRPIKDARGESNRIANKRENEQKYESLIGSVSPKKYGEKDDVAWSKKTSLVLERSIRDGSLKREHEKYDDI